MIWTVVLGVGLVLLAAGVVLLLDLGGAGGAVIRRVTSRPLGDLAPGYAATTGGFRVYAVLIVAMGLAVGGLGISAAAPLAGAIAIGIGILAFITASVIAIVGEVRTYRALPGRGKS